MYKYILYFHGYVYSTTDVSKIIDTVCFKNDCTDNVRKKASFRRSKLSVPKI